MVEKKSVIRIRITKDDMFGILKLQNPEMFDKKSLLNVVYFGEDPTDPSKIMIEFTEE